MPVSGLFHIAIKTADLDATIKFYSEVIGLRLAERPPLTYPGAWLAVPDGPSIIHIYAGEPAKSADGKVASGTAAIDHVSITASGYHDFIASFRRHGLDWRENKVPNTTLWQLFVYDPSGVQLELTFEGSRETGPTPNMSDERRYVAGISFFRPAR